MKKVKLNGKLSLNKKTISKLNNNEMNAVKGGDQLDERCTGSISDSINKPVLNVIHDSILT